MTSSNIYKDIATRTGGDIYIGVVGPVRTGKSTFIKRFMDTAVIPNINGDFAKERAKDELPQSAAGRTIMTTEPKFIPENAIEIQLDEASSFKVRMIDCVGYIVPSSYGYIEDDGPRMVMTPWYDEPVPFNMAAEVGTKKVINEHSSIGLVITTDGTISDIPREEYAEAEERVISELKEIQKPFIVLLNSMYPQSEATQALAAELTQQYGTTVLPVSCVDLTEDDIKNILSQILFEFPIRKVEFTLPLWINALEKDHWLRKELYGYLKTCCNGIEKIKDVRSLAKALSECDKIMNSNVQSINLGCGTSRIALDIDRAWFYKILTEATGLTIENEQELMSALISLSKIKSEYERIKNALDEVEATGYGIVMPSIEELTLQEPEIVKQGGRYGVRLRASAPSIHMMKANITTEVSPIVGSEKQSEDLVMYLLKEFESDPIKIWDSNIFGKSLNELVNEGLHTKLARMPADARMRLQETLERVINEGCSGLICIIL
ncbi:MAG: stage IV sporulation protein A [Clostridia bacterium]|nr:stage IV sporulation protein A [Clostridia bacterium]